MKKNLRLGILLLAIVIALASCGKKADNDTSKEVKQESSSTAIAKANKDKKDSSSSLSESLKVSKDDKKEKKPSEDKKSEVKESKTIVKTETKDSEQVDTNSNSQTTSSNGSYPSSSSAKTVSSSYTANDSDANYETKTETEGEEKHEPKPVYVDKWIPEEGHWETVVIKEAWTEEVPVYEQQERVISNDTGEDWTDLTEDEIAEKSIELSLAGGKGSWSVKYIDVQVGTEKIYHEAETEDKWVVDVPGHYEKVLDHYE